MRVRNLIRARTSAMAQEKVAFAGAQSMNGSQPTIPNTAVKPSICDKLNGYCTKALPVTCGMVTVFERSGDVMLIV
jgi:hypothetical protein